MPSKSTLPYATKQLDDTVITPRQRDHLANVLRRHKLKRSSQATEVLRPAPFTPGLYET